VLDKLTEKRNRAKKEKHKKQQVALYEVFRGRLVEESKFSFLPFKI